MRVKGTKWTIFDYHRVKTDGNTEAECMINNFYHNLDEYTLGRPTPTKSYQDFQPTDIRDPGEAADLMKALKWIGETKTTRLDKNRCMKETMY